MKVNTIYNQDFIIGGKNLLPKSIQCCVTSPPYFALRDYGVEKSKWPEITFKLNEWVPETVVPAMECCLGLEPDTVSFIAHLVHVFRIVRESLRDDGVLWVNMGDSYATSGKNRTKEQAEAKSTLQGSKKSQSQSLKQQSKIVSGIKPKDLMGIPWMMALSMRADGWFLRQDIIWNKPNPMPESVTDRCSKSHEYIFLFSKSQKYFFDAESIRTPLADDSIARLAQDIENQKGSSRGYAGKRHNGNMKSILKKSFTSDQAGSGKINNVNRSGCFDGDGNLMVRPTANRKSVWTITTAAFKEAHFATFPEDIPEICIKAGTSKHGCCSKCYAPYKRVTETELLPTKKAAKISIVDERDHTADKNSSGSNRQKDGHLPGHYNQITTLGWSPSCDCDAPVIPCTVLDPFSGSGKTPITAAKLDRNYIAFEISPEYHKMSEKISHQQLGLFNI